MKVDVMKREIKGFSFTYEATSRSLPRRRCPACGRKGGLSETRSVTNGGAPQVVITCNRCGHAEAKGS